MEVSKQNGQKCRAFAGISAVAPYDEASETGAQALERTQSDPGLLGRHAHSDPAPAVYPPAMPLRRTESLADPSQIYEVAI